MNKDRWVRIGLVAAIVFAINVAGRIITRVAVDDVDTEDRVALLTFAAIAVTLGIVGFVWVRRHQLSDILTDLAGAVFFGGLLCLLVGPFVSGTTPFEAGIGELFIQAGLYAAYAGGGALIGVLAVIMVGQDYRSRSLARYAEEKLSKPRRVVRR